MTSNFIKGIPRIKKLARRYGTPLKSINAGGNSIEFIFMKEGQEQPFFFQDAVQGIDDTIKMFEELLAKENSEFS